MLSATPETPMVLAGKTLSPTGRNGSQTKPTVPGPWAKASPAMWPRFLNFQFLLHFQKNRVKFKNL
jgi:hypothetical protein